MAGADRLAVRTHGGRRGGREHRRGRRFRSGRGALGADGAGQQASQRNENQFFHETEGKMRSHLRIGNRNAGGPNILIKYNLKYIIYYQIIAGGAGPPPFPVLLGNGLSLGSGGKGRDRRLSPFCPFVLPATWPPRRMCWRRRATALTSSPPRHLTIRPVGEAFVQASRRKRHRPYRASGTNQPRVEFTKLILSARFVNFES